MYIFLEKSFLSYIFLYVQILLETEKTIPEGLSFTLYTLLQIIFVRELKVLPMIESIKKDQRHIW